METHRTIMMVLTAATDKQDSLSLLLHWKLQVVRLPVERSSFQLDLLSCPTFLFSVGRWV